MGLSHPQDVFAQNRAEELGYDVWEHFVVPPFFDRLSLEITRKPRIIVGGRGCGKTMLLRYLSHESMFSPRRREIPTTVLKHIGLYWRSDTQFAQLMEGRGLPQDTWQGAFNHLAALVLSAEVLRSLESIAGSQRPYVTVEQTDSLVYGALRAFDASLPDNHRDLRESLEYRLAEFETWVNDVRSVQQPRFLPGEAFVKRLIRIVAESIPALQESGFFVYVDEYENLAEYQQEIINAWLKHSEPPLIFNLAMKRNGFKTRKTTGDETLSDIHDFRVLDLEDYDVGNQFPVFAAEILLLKLALAGCTELPIELVTLRDPSALRLRRSDAYAKRVLDAVRGVFPSLSQLELARGVFADPTLRERLLDRVRRGLKTRRANQELVQDLVSPDQPEASVVVACLLFRTNLPVDEIVVEMRCLRAGRDNGFTGSANWIHNNFIGCLLQLHDGLPRPCPFYGGFDTFSRMARGNLRHFLELCHQSLAREDIRWEAGLCPVPVDKQAVAARQASAEFLSEVRSFGPQGNNLHAFVLRLGSIFALSQQQPSQSEPERNHFLVRGHLTELGQSEMQFLSEAIKWSVLFEEKETKKKSAIDPEGNDFVLNPIYAPYFHISYRKRRKVEFTAEELRVLMRGDYAEVRALIQEFRKRWNVDIRDTSLPLFAHLEEGETQ